MADSPVTLSLLVGGTIVLIAVSWRSFRHPRFHGFSRFFAFEAILCVVVLNASRWFYRPFASLQLVSWSLLMASLYLAADGFYLLRKLGKPSAPEPDSPMFRVENTAVLVTTGVYRLIRHPLYASLLYFAWGATLKSMTPLSTVLAIIASLCLVATAKSEEAENLRRFGDAYREYMAGTRLFIPFVV